MPSTQGERVSWRDRDVVVRIPVAHGGGNPFEGEVVIVKDFVEFRFFIAYCKPGEFSGTYQHAFGFPHVSDESGMSRAYVQALHYAVRRAELR